MNEAIVINEATLKQLVPLSVQVDTRFTRPAIVIAQDLQLRALLGAAYFAYLLNAITTATTNADDDLLLQQVQKMMAWYTMFYMANQFQNRAENKGFEINSDSIANPSEQVAMMRTEFRGLAEHYRDYFTGWLCDYRKANPLAFPLMTPTTEACCDTNSIATHSGIVFYEGVTQRLNNYYNSTSSR